MDVRTLREKLLEGATHHIEKSIEETDAEDARHYAEACATFVAALAPFEDVEVGSDGPALSDGAQALLMVLVANVPHHQAADWTGLTVETVERLKGELRELYA